MSGLGGVDRRTRNVLKAVVDLGIKKAHAQEIAKWAEVPLGTMYGLLIQLSDHRGLLEFEDIPAPGRPDRRCYRLSEKGRRILGIVE